MAREIRIYLNDDQERKYDEIALASVGNKTVVKSDLIEYAINRFHKKLYKPDKILKELSSDKHE